MDRALLERMIGAIALVLLLVIVAPALLDGTRESSSDRLSDAQDDQDVRTEVIVLNEPRDPEILPTPEPATDPLQSGIIVGARSAPAVTAGEALSRASSGVTQAEPAKTSGENKAEVPTPTPTPTPTPAPTPAPAPAKAPAAVPTPPREVVAKQPVVAPRPVAKESAVVPKASPDRPDTTRVAADTATAAGFAVQLGSFGQAENARKYAAELSGRGFATFVRSGSTATGTIHRVYAGPRPSRDAAEQLASVLGGAGYKGIVVDLSAGSGTR